MTKDKVKTLVIPYSYWYEEHHMTREEIQYMAEMCLKDNAITHQIRFIFDYLNGDLIGIYFDADDPDADNYPLVSWEHLDTFLFNQKNWEIARRNASRGEDTILDEVDDMGNFKGKSYVVLKEHKFGKDMSDLKKAHKSSIPIPPPKSSRGFG